MQPKRYIFLILTLILSSFAHAQGFSRCVAHIQVADTHYLADSVRYRLLGPDDADSLFWHPAALFPDSTARQQTVTLACDDTAKIHLTAYYHNVNLFHWREPGFVRSHTGYHYFDTPADGDFCHPRSITMDANPVSFCAEAVSAFTHPGIIIRTDTLRPYGDSLPAFFPYDSTRMNEYFSMSLPGLRSVPTDSAYAPFYIDTIEMWNPNRDRIHILNINMSRIGQDIDSLAALPGLIMSVHIDDTAVNFFDADHIIPLRDTTLILFPSPEFPRPTVLPSHSRTSAYYFNSIPHPHGTAIFRFYEIPTIYYNTHPFVNINRIEMLGDCLSSDSLTLAGPPCGCTVSDTLSRTICSLQLPYQWDSLVFTAPQQRIVRISSFPCDTLHTLILHVNNPDTLWQHDTVMQNDMPWEAFGRTFDSAGNYHFVLPATQSECDTVVHYSLTVLSNIFDTVLTFLCPGQLPYICNGVVVHADTLFTITYPVRQRQDSIVTYIVHIKQNTDTIIRDTIVDSQLPWPFLDSLFTDTVSNITFHLTNEQGCDSIIHYNLFIFWNGDHCDSSLSFPNVVTPNADGFNDCFVIDGLIENHCYPYNQLIIIDRTGRVVFRAINISRPDHFWNPAESRAPAGTYFYRFVGRGINHATQHQGCIELLK